MNLSITGLAINTPLGDQVDAVLNAMDARQSAITHWKTIETQRIHSKIGGDLSLYDWKAKLAALVMPLEVRKRAAKICSRVPWSTKLTVLLALEAWGDAGLFDASVDSSRVAVIISGHNLMPRYQVENVMRFLDEPDYVDPSFALVGLDSHQASAVSEVLGTHGPAYTVGGACASGNLALRAGAQEIAGDSADIAVVCGPVLDYSPLELQAMALLGAISFTSFNDAPEKASRPFDRRREGFVPSHAGATVILERPGRTRAKAHLRAVEMSSDASHLTEPSEESQVKLMIRVLQKAGLKAGDIGFVSAHATSTPAGDLAEANALLRVFDAQVLKVNAPKSLLGHPCWSAALVETVLGIAQVERGILHPTINVDERDAALGLEICSTGPATCAVQYWMNDSFGFGGLNCISVFERA